MADMKAIRVSGYLQRSTGVDLSPGTDERDVAAAQDLAVEVRYDFSVPGQLRERFGRGDRDNPTHSRRYELFRAAQLCSAMAQWREGVPLTQEGAERLRDQAAALRTMEQALREQWQGTPVKEPAVGQFTVQV